MTSRKVEQTLGRTDRREDSLRCSLSEMLTSLLWYSPSSLVGEIPREVIYDSEHLLENLSLGRQGSSEKAFSVYLLFSMCPGLNIINMSKWHVLGCYVLNSHSHILGSHILLPLRQPWPSLWPQRPVSWHQGAEKQKSTQWYFCQKNLVPYIAREFLLAALFPTLCLSGPPVNYLISSLLKLATVDILATTRKLYWYTPRFLCVLSGSHSGLWGPGQLLDCGALLSSRGHHSHGLNPFPHELLWSRQPLTGLSALFLPLP